MSAFRLKTNRLLIRTPRFGDGKSVAYLWKELWNLHESWGSYPGSQDDMTYHLLASELEYEWAKPKLSLPPTYLHLIAVKEEEELIVGQVEALLRVHPPLPGRTPTLYVDVRSFVVKKEFRNQKIGKELLRALEIFVRQNFKEHSYFFCLEVLEKNPWKNVYYALGYTPFSQTFRIDREAIQNLSFSKPTPSCHVLLSSEVFVETKMRQASEERASFLKDSRARAPSALNSRKIELTRTFLPSSHSNSTFEKGEKTPFVIKYRDNVSLLVDLELASLDLPFLKGHKLLVHYVHHISNEKEHPIRNALEQLFRHLLPILKRYQISFFEMTNLPYAEEEARALFQALRELGGAPWSTHRSKWEKGS